MKMGVYFNLEEYAEEFKEYPEAEEAKSFVKNLEKFSQEDYIRKHFIFYTGFIKNATLFPGDYAVGVFGYSPPGIFIDYPNGMYEIGVYGIDLTPILLKEFDSAEHKERAEQFFDKFQNIVPCSFDQLSIGFKTESFPLVKNNDGRLFCYWCTCPTKVVNTGIKFYNVCTVCGK